MNIKVRGGAIQYRHLVLCFFRQYRFYNLHFRGEVCFTCNNSGVVRISSGIKRTEYLYDLHIHNNSFGLAANVLSTCYPTQGHSAIAVYVCNELL